MKKGVIISVLAASILLMFMVPLASAEVFFTKTPVASTVIKEFSTPAIFNFTITNKQAIEETYFIDTLLGYSIQPRSVSVPASSTQSFLVKSYFTEKMRDEYSGTYQFSFYVKGQNTGIKDDTMKIRIVSFKNAVDIKLPEAVAMDDKTLVITIENKEDVVLDLNLKINSELFAKEDKIAFEPYEKKEITITLEKEKIWKEAGDYDVVITLGADEYSLDTKKTIELVPKKEITTDEKKINLLFYKKVKITKTNTGNVRQIVEVVQKQSSFANSFTHFNVEPEMSEKDNALELTWEKELGLGEQLVVESTTNYSLPLGVIIFIFIVGFIYIKAKTHKFSITKKATKVKTNTGEFAVKIVLFLKNHSGSDITDISVTDRLPVIGEYYEKYGTTKPDVIKKDRLGWKIDRIERGQQKALTYILFSKIRVVGRLTLPRAYASYSIDSKSKDTNSNEVHLIS